MNRMFFRLVVIVIFSLPAIESTLGQEKIELKHADELAGKIIDGQNVREANGNVEFIQGNVKVYCNSATQFTDADRIELRGNVKIYQDTLSLFTSKAVYFGDDRRAVCEGGVTLKDPNATVNADNGIYSFGDAKAIFKGNVIIVNPDYKITSSELTYLRNTEDSFAKGNVVVTTDSSVIKADNIDFYKRQGMSIAVGNVAIESDSTVIAADSATNFSAEKKSFATGNVKIASLNNNTLIFGNAVQNFEKINYTILTGGARLIQVSNEKDTLRIYSDTMEAFRNSDEYYIARKDVEIIRDKFLSRCGRGIYYKKKETISLSNNPVAWQDNLQMTGDSIYAELPNNKLHKIYINKTKIENSAPSFLISQNKNPDFNDRYDQISGDSITMDFTDDKIDLVIATGSAQSINFLYDKEKANGLNKTEGNKLTIYFDAEGEVEKIKVDANPSGEYVPEQLLNTVSLTLPGFNVRVDKPVVRFER